MKLRQKLAAVLAATMVVTAVPVVTFAASTTSISKVHTTTNTDDAIGNSAPVLTIDLKDAFTGNEFYLQLEGSEWENNTATTPQVLDIEGTVVGSFERLSKTEAKITLDAQTTGKVQIKLQNTIVKADEAVVIVDSNNTEVSDAKVVFARKQEGEVTVKAGTAATFYTGLNTIADIEFEETVGSQLVTGTYEFDLALDTNDFEFVNGSVTVEGTRGLKNSAVTLTGRVKESDGSRAVLEVTVAIPAGQTMSRGGFVVKGIKVEDTTATPSLGSIKMEIGGANSAEQKLVSDTEVVVAEVSEYGGALVVTKKDDNLVEVGNGKQAKVTFELKETTQDSFGGRDVEFVLENGFIDTSVFGTTDGTTTTSVKVNGTTKSVEVEKIYKDKSKKKETEIIGFTMRLQGDDSTKETYKFEDMKINAPIDAEGDIKLTVSGRGMNEEVEAAIATIKAQFAVSFKAMNVEVGVKGQKGGVITITEDDKATIARGTVIKVALPNDDDLAFKKPVVEATGEMEVSIVDDKVKTDADGNPYLEVKVDRASKEAATITIKDFEVATDRSVADGSYDVKVSLSDRTGEIKGADFFVVGDGFATIETTITNGATEMVVNGAKVALDAPAFLENGKMMVPLRAVAEAFGIASKDIVYNAGEIVIFANGRTVALTIGSTDAYVNGAKMTLANPAKIVNDRTTVPVGDLARLLGLSVEWDNTTKTATFAN